MSGVYRFGGLPLSTDESGTVADMMINRCHKDNERYLVTHVHVASKIDL